MRVPIIKWFVLVALMGCFHALDGFDPPVVSQEDYRASRRMMRAWVATVILFVAGAVMVLWGNAIAQWVHWDVPDGLYPIMGALLLVAGLVWIMMVRDSVRL